MNDSLSYIIINDIYIHNTITNKSLKYLFVHSYK